MNLDALKRFEESEDYFKLTKVDSKRPSLVGVGQFETGVFRLVKMPADSYGPEWVSVCIMGGSGINPRFLRTSPIVKIVDHDENSTTFETEGGVYRLEKYNGNT